ncbi:MAG: hypothetical protein KDF65_00845 [Anaerolineae bacterium]|nr:hypothetical protein [Anaerolineae bacterium]
MSDTSTADLIQQGLTAARVGDVADARRLLAEATRQSPTNIEAWLGLAGVVESLEEKRHCFATAVALDPNHQEAKAGLALVEQKLGSNSPISKAPVADEPPATPTTFENETGVGFCYRHPQTETALRCNRCNKLICPKCAQRTPVGFRCPDCIREQENKYYSGGNLDYVIAAVVSFILSLLAAGAFTFILGGLGFFVLFIAFILAPIVAGFIAEAVRWTVGRRRSRYLGRISAGALVLATLPFLLLNLLAGSIFGLIAPGLFLFLGVTTILARLR